MYRTHKPNLNFCLFVPCHPRSTTTIIRRHHFSQIWSNVLDTQELKHHQSKQIGSDSLTNKSYNNHVFKNSQKHIHNRMKTSKQVRLESLQHNDLPNDMKTEKIQSRTRTQLQANHTLFNTKSLTLFFWIQVITFVVSFWVWVRLWFEWA